MTCDNRLMYLLKSMNLISFFNFPVYCISDMNLPSDTPVYHQTAPVYHQTAPVYHQTAPVYHQTAPVYHQTAPVYEPVYGCYHLPPPVFDVIPLSEPSPVLSPIYTIPQKPCIHRRKPVNTDECCCFPL